MMCSLISTSDRHLPKELFRGRLLAALAAALVVACSGSSSGNGGDVQDVAQDVAEDAGAEATNGNTVSSSDGALSLEMPPTALPEGVSLDDVEVGLLYDELPEGFSIEGPGEFLGAYELLPDGLELLEPQVGSNTRSPGSVAMSMQRWITFTVV